jgi:hypothetical protein
VWRFDKLLRRTLKVEFRRLAQVDPDVSPALLLTERPDPRPDTTIDSMAGRLVERRPWRPPMPLQPSELDAMFQPGTRYALRGGGPAGVVDVKRAGLLRMPSGRLILADPAWLDSKLWGFAIYLANQPTHRRRGQRPAWRARR